MEQIITQQLLYDGIPEGRIIATISGKTVEAYKIPRKYFDDCNLRLMTDFTHLNFSGIYILLGDDDTGNRFAYIGKGGVRCSEEGIIKRISEHDENEVRENKIDNWDEVVILTSAVDDLNAGIGWLENKFILAAKEANRLIIKNGNNGSAGSPTQNEIIIFNNYYNWACFLIRTFGYKFLDPKVNKDNKQLLKLQVKDCDARGQLNGDEFVLIKGSKISQEEVTSCPDKAKLDRLKYKDDVKNGILQTDLIFGSPSGAAQFASGRSVNGYLVWKDENNKSLREVLNNSQ